MKNNLITKFLGIVVLGFLLFGCATTYEPEAQNNNNIKAKDSVKIIYSDPNDIFIMHNESIFSTDYAMFKVPASEYRETAFNHCSMYKKNLYYLYANFEGNAILYDHIRFKYQNKIYKGYRFICAEAKSHAISAHTILPLPLTFYNEYNQYRFSYGTTSEVKAVERKRILSEVEIAENKRKKIEEQKRLAVLEKLSRQKLAQEYEVKYKNLCLKTENNNKFIKGTDEYIDCLIDEENKAVARKIEEDFEKRRKKEELEKKLAAMSPTERHSYNCTETFNFKKGTEQFNNCVFELYKAELDIQKLELEKELAEAKAKAASSEQARAEAVAKAQIASANANKRAAKLNSSMQLMKLSNSLIKGTQQQSTLNNNNFRLKTTCSNVGGFLTCF